MIYITTHHRTKNFGACLQSYALQKTLDSMGYDSRLILLRDERDKKPPKALKKRVRHYFLKLYRFFHRRTILKGEEAFNEFFLKYHKTTSPYENFATLQKNPPKGEVYLSGSDQVFNPTDVKPLFFLQFGDKNTKRISYAGSVSVQNVPENAKEIFRRYLSAFDRLSIRESESLPLVNAYYDKNVEVHVDPSYLLAKEEWEKLSAESRRTPLKKPYILVYILYRPLWLNAYLKKLYKETGYEIVTVQYDTYRRIYGTKTVRDAGPLEFLKLIRDAEMVISSSYHGCVFSSIFKKPFYAVVNPASPARIHSMLQLFHLTDRVLSAETKPAFEIDYTYFEEVLPKEIEKSKRYLKEAIEG
ncbi:MAG: polysaccharide pyruvyl transferase family protein [Clostridia bacterium]|nr:polysaccharide pyruvyl transferase family protein [Clostridia bacterium]